MRLAIFFSLFAITNFPVFAAVNANFSGFGTVGAVLSDSDHYGYRKDISGDNGVYAGELDFKNNSLLGLQLDISLSEKSDFVLQSVLRDLPSHKLDRYINLAFLRHNFSTNWSARVGRTSADLYLITEFRDVNFSYIWTTPPNEVYSIIPFRSLDGVDVTYQSRLNDGSFSFKLFTGKAEADITSAQVKELITLKNVYGLSVSYDTFNWFLQGKYTQVEVTSESKSNLFLIDQLSQLPNFIWPNAADFSEQLLGRGARAHYYSINTQYTNNNWLYTAELARISSKNKSSLTVRSGYVAVSYEYGRHNFYSIYGATNSEHYDFNEPNVNVAAIPELITAITWAKNYLSTNQQTISFGWRNNVSANSALSIQLNHTHIEEDGGTLWLNRKLDTSSDTISTLLLNYSFTF